MGHNSNSRRYKAPEIFHCGLDHWESDGTVAVASVMFMQDQTNGISNDSKELSILTESTWHTIITQSHLTIVTT